MAGILYKPVGLLISVLGGVVAGAVFKRVWRAVANESEAPKATDQNRGLVEVVIASAAEGAVFAGVKALLDRAGARAFAWITGTWPGPKAAARD
jgi:hypothetical protein